MKQKGFVFVETIIIIVILTLGFMTIYISFSSILTNNKRKATFNDIEYIYRTYYIQDFLTTLNIEEWTNYYLGPKVTDASGAYISGGKKIQEFSCLNNNLYKINGNVSSSDSLGTLTPDESNRKSFCETLISVMGVKHIYITKYNVNDLKFNTTYGGKIANGSVCAKTNMATYLEYQDLCTMSTNMIYYLRTLTGKDDDAYRIIVEYEEKITDSDSTVTMLTKAKVNGSCPTNYTEVDGVCKRCPDGYKEKSGICEREIKRNYYSNVKMVMKSKIDQS